MPRINYLLFLHKIRISPISKPAVYIIAIHIVTATLKQDAKVAMIAVKKHTV